MICLPLWKTAQMRGGLDRNYRQDACLWNPGSLGRADSRLKGLRSVLCCVLGFPVLGSHLFDSLEPFVSVGGRVGWFGHLNTTGGFDHVRNATEVSRHPYSQLVWRLVAHVGGLGYLAVCRDSGLA